MTRVRVHPLLRSQTTLYAMTALALVLLGAGLGVLVAFIPGWVVR